MTFITGFQYIFCTFSFYAEKPFKESVLKNSYFLGALFFFIALHTLFCLLSEKHFQSLFNVKIKYKKNYHFFLRF